MFSIDTIFYKLIKLGFFAQEIHQRKKDYKTFFNVS